LEIFLDNQLHVKLEEDDINNFKALEVSIKILSNIMGNFVSGVAHNMHIGTYTHIHAYIYTHKTYIYTYIHTYTHTHRYTYTHIHARAV